MKWLLIIAAVIVALIAIMYLVGLSLPVKHTATVEDTIPASLEQVWARITDVQNFPSWRKNLKTVELTNDTEWVEVMRGDNIPMKITEQVLQKRLVGTINSKDLPFGGHWVYELQPAANGTQLRITENGEVYNPMFRFISKYIMGHSSTMK